MPASFPSAVKTFATRSNGQVVDASHVNDAQDEIHAIEDWLLNGGLPTASSISTLASLSVTGGSTLTTLNVTGGSTLTTLQAGASTHTSLSVSGGSTLTTLNVTGGSTVTTFQAGNSTIAGSLNVTGQSTLASVTVTGGSTLASLNVTGNSTVGGGLTVIGGSTLASLNVNGNSTISGNLTLAGTFSPSRLGCVASNSAIQNVNSAAFTGLNWDTKQSFDTQGMLSTSVNSSRITLLRLGLYTIGATVGWSANSTVGNYRQLKIRINDLTDIVLDCRDPLRNSAIGLVQSVATMYQCSSITDFAVVQVAQDSGSTMSISTAASVTRFWAVLTGA